MQALTMVAALVIAAVGQKLNANPKIPTSLVKLGMALIGPLLFLIAEAPAAATREAFLVWFDHAWIWSLAIPGAASLIGLAPGMATKPAPTS